MADYPCTLADVRALVAAAQYAPPFTVYVSRAAAQTLAAYLVGHIHIMDHPWPVDQEAALDCLVKGRVSIDGAQIVVTP